MAMSLIQRSNGVFYGVFSVHGKRIWRTTESRDRAEAEVIYDVLCREHIQWKGLTIMKFRNLVTELTSRLLAPATISLYRSALTRLAEIVGDLRLSRVSPYHVQKFLSIRMTQVSPTKASIDFRTLRAAFTRAVKLRIIDSNPFDSVDNVRIPESDPVFMTREDFERLFRVIDDWRIRTIVVLAICTTMRVSEILSLRWEDIDLQKGVIRLSNRNGFTTKNRRRRLVPLNTTARRFLLAYPKTADYVFVSRRCTPFTRQTVSRMFKMYLRRAGLPEELHFHSLRHSAATWMSQSNVPIPNISAIMGHSNIATTMIYAHTIPAQLKESVEAIDHDLQVSLSSSCSPEKAVSSKSLAR